MFDKQDVTSQTNAVSLFRKHRHDILNQLQLIRAYIQIGRMPDAIRIVDATAVWLQSLTVWQTRCKGVAERLVWIASNCPHVILRSIDEIIVWNEDIVSEIEQALLSLEEDASDRGWTPLDLYIHNSNEKDISIQIIVKVASESQLPVVLGHGKSLCHVMLTVNRIDT